MDWIVLSREQLQLKPSRIHAHIGVTYSKKKSFSAVLHRSMMMQKFFAARTFITSQKMYLHIWLNQPALTKIVATIGPVSENFETLQKIVTEGMRVMRINFSHATYEEANLRVKNLRSCVGVNKSGLRHDFNLRAIMIDTQGPEIRTGLLSGDAESIRLEEDSVLNMTTDERFRKDGTAKKIWVGYPDLLKSVHVGSRILLDDGLIECIVIKIYDDSVDARIINGGSLRPRRGVNLPGAHVTLPALSEKDKRDIIWGINNDVDFVAASFVRKSEDINEIRNFIKFEHSKVFPPGHPMPQIISKIENTEAIDNFEDILKSSDAIMVARGDLGVEIPMEQVTNMQKRMVEMCNRAGKPVIVATQMLESMQVQPRPTRAEVSDVTNAVYDGADCVMLSGESAQGKFPVDAVSMMRRIIHEAEQWQQSRPNSDSFAPTLQLNPATNDFSDGIARAAVFASIAVNAKIILVLTEDGNLPNLVSKYKPNVPVICACLSQKVGRQLILSRGLHPMVVKWDVDEGETDAHLYSKRAIDGAIAMGFCQTGDTVIMVGRGDKFGSSKDTASLRIRTVP